MIGVKFFFKIQKSQWIYTAAAYLIIACVYHPKMYAAPLRHMQNSTDSASKFQLQDSCQIIGVGEDLRWCNPANLSFNEDINAEFNFGVRAEEDGARIVQKAQNKHPQKTDIEALFKQKKFSAFSAYARLETIYKNTSISYTPAHIIAAYRIANPALPEIALSGLYESIIEIQSGFKISKIRLFDIDWSLHGGGSLYQFDRKFIFINDQLINLLVNQTDSIGNQSSKTGIDADIGFILQNDHSYFPDLGISQSRLFHRSDENSYSEPISLSNYLTRQTSMSLGKNIKLRVGQFGIEVNEHFKNTFESPDTLSTSLGLKYNLGGLTAFVSRSPLMSSFGFSFQGPIYLVGIQYTNEKQPNDFQLERQRMTYVFVKIRI